ncbi:MAG: aldehyde ferredoxin oxidoreductase [Anaerolineales bacterium]|nr:MAG: aldehyde ferredoxin oxidoreductase [Anaerolineales bacterium]
MDGYMGKLLAVDLSSGEIQDELLNMEYAHQFIGGSGLAARYLYDLLDPGLEPLHPANPLLFVTGPLTGTRAPLYGRHVVCARSPLTGIWNESHAGGFVGAELRFAGYDGIIIRGRSPKPVCLWVQDGKAELRDAGHLWGKDTFETQAIVKEELGDPRVRVACIGPAGENQVLLANIIHDHARAAGRGGMGAVMGSKNLKAVAVRGHGRIPVADEERFKELARQVIEILKDDFMSDMLHETGTACAMEQLSYLGSLPSRYYTQGVFEGVETLSGGFMADTILTGTSACYGCVVGCGRKVTVSEGRYTFPEIDGPEYETICGLGTTLLIDDLAAVSWLGHLCDGYGMDTMSAGSTIGFAHYLFQEGIIGPQDTGGLTLQWGDPDTVVELLGQMAHKKGFGALLSEGSRRLGQRFGVEELAVQVKGLEVAYHDPRALSAMALVYSTSPIGASHNHSDMYWVEVGRSLEEMGIPFTDRLEDAGKGPLVARHQDWRSVTNALIVCAFNNAPAQYHADLLNAATGRQETLDSLLHIGERIWNLKRAFNHRLGLTRADDKLPQLLLQPLSEGGTQGHVPDLELMLREYYEARDWDPDTGKPSREKLLSLGLEEMAGDLWGLGQ